MQFVLRLIIGDAQSNEAHVNWKMVETLHYIVLFIVRKHPQVTFTISLFHVAKES